MLQWALYTTLMVMEKHVKE